MNRRNFFKLLGAATALSAGGIALIETSKTFFLPPRGGWATSPIQMREVCQYIITNDSLGWRWDFAWVDSLGERQQANVLAYEHGDRESARAALEQMAYQKGYRPGRDIQLPLPQAVMSAAYV